jgi:hypothetical protein
MIGSPLQLHSLSLGALGHRMLSLKLLVVPKGVLCHLLRRVQMLLHPVIERS